MHRHGDRASYALKTNINPVQWKDERWVSLVSVEEKGVSIGKVHPNKVIHVFIIEDNKLDL